MSLQGKTVVLGVSGSVACYRACDLARDLMRGGAAVTVCLTDSAQEFVRPALFEALTGRPCLVSAFDEPERGRMAHIDLARRADLVVVAPATANVLNKLAAGIGDDMLTTLVLAHEGLLVVAPAMNPSMYAHETIRASLKALVERGAVLVEPADGEVACGEQGQGKLASNAAILEAVQVTAEASGRLDGKRVLITSGPTQEPLDDVRYLGNRSSGKMGAALAQAALLMGAEVTVVTGPAPAPLPRSARVVRVRTALEMLEAARAEVGTADIVIGAAAVADFRPAEARTGKLRKEEGAPEIRLVANPDVVSELAKLARPGATTVAFAAEPGPDLEEARAKRRRKGVAAIAVNDVSDSEIGFESDLNELVLITEGGEERSPRAGKLRCALWLLDRLAAL